MAPTNIFGTLDSIAHLLATFGRLPPLSVSLSKEAVGHGGPGALQGLLGTDALGQCFPNCKARAVIEDDLKSYEK